MGVESFRSRSRPGRSTAVPQLVVLALLCASTRPPAALAVPLAGQAVDERAPDAPEITSTAARTLEAGRPPASTLVAQPSTAATPSRMAPSPGEPAHAAQPTVSAVPTMRLSVSGSPTPPAVPVQVATPGQPSLTATAAVSQAMGTPVQSTSAVVVAQALHLREGPGARYPIRAMYSRGIEVRVLGRDRTAQWLRVVTPDERAGWMARAALALRVPLSDLLIVDGGPLPGETAGQDPSPDGGGGLSASGSRAPSDSGIAASAADVPAIMDAPKGLAIVGVEQTFLHIAAGTRSEGVQVLRKDEQVKLLGQARGAWVRVQPFSAVVPGWVYAADLRPLPGAIPDAPAAAATLTATPAITTTPPISDVSPTPKPTPTMMVVEGVPEPEAATGAPVPPRLPVEIAVTIVEGALPPHNRAPASMRTPAETKVVVGMRVQIVTIFGDVLVEAMTPASGNLTFTRDVPADTALYVQLPALGLRMRLPQDQVQAGKVSITIAVPSAAP